MTIKITNVVEPGEMSLSGLDTLSVEENASDLSLETYTAVDPGGATIAWSVEGVDASAFSIGTTSGELSLKASPDYETPTDADTDNIYRVVVKATAGSKSVRRDVTVTVTAVNEPPVISGPTTVRFAENSSGYVATYTVTDPEGDRIHYWSLAGPYSDMLYLYDVNPPKAGSKELEFDYSPDYETRNSYSITITASDGARTMVRWT